jgi:hypothetical protein
MNVAEPSQRLLARGTRRETVTGDEVGSVHLEVKRDLVVDIAVVRRASRREAEHATDALRQCRTVPVSRAHVVRSTANTASA